MNAGKHSLPTVENQLWHAQTLLLEKGRAALENPHAMIGRQCGCGTCFTCAAAFVCDNFHTYQEQLPDPARPWVAVWRRRDQTLHQLPGDRAVIDKYHAIYGEYPSRVIWRYVE